MADFGFILAVVSAYPTTIHNLYVNVIVALCFTNVILSLHQHVLKVHDLHEILTLFIGIVMGTLLCKTRYQTHTNFGLEHIF